MLRAFRTPLPAVRVLILGQDPYPTPGHPIGLSFAVDPHVRPIPRSLANIYRELQADLGVAPVPHGDLTAWTERGVLLLNREPHRAPGRAGLPPRQGLGGGHRAGHPAASPRAGARSSRSCGATTPAALAPLLGDVPRVESAHPSPLSASRGFFGSRPFSRTNELLREQGAERDRLVAAGLTAGGGGGQQSG